MIFFSKHTYFWPIGHFQIYMDTHKKKLLKNWPFKVCASGDSGECDGTESIITLQLLVTK